MYNFLLQLIVEKDKNRILEEKVKQMVSTCINWYFKAFHQSVLIN